MYKRQIPDRTGQHSVLKDTVSSGFSRAPVFFNKSSKVTDYSGISAGYKYRQSAAVK